MPVYNVEDYLAECLDSLRAQTFGDFEAVMVDDGATDGSVAIARKYSGKDRRFRLLRQQNAGLAAARNAGVAAARGEYLAFLDSDDVLPPSAYADLMSTIERTGSDFVVGTLEQTLRGRRTLGRLMRENHRARQEAVRPADAPLLLADVFAVNKVFRRSFWGRADLSFPVGVRYEDQPALTRAFLAAERVDVIPETVYQWRVREDGTSITQRRHDLADLEDRVTTKRWSTDEVLRHAPWARDVWFRKVLPVDMWMYFRAATEAPDEYWVRLRDAVREFWNDETVPFDRTDLPAQQRLMGWLVAADRRADLRELIEYVDAHQRTVPLEIRGRSVVGVLPGLGDPEYGAPQDAYVLRAEELPWRSRVLGAQWEGRHLRLEGFSLVAGLPALGHAAALGARAVAPGGVSVALQPQRTGGANSPAGPDGPSDAHHDCDFVMVVDLGQLGDAGPGEHPVRWRFELELATGSLSTTGWLDGCRPGVCDGTWRVVEGVGEARLGRDNQGVFVEVRATPGRTGRAGRGARRSIS